jgi:phage virion morphogenesis protein
VTGAAFEISFNDGELQGALARLAEGAADTSPLMRVIGDYGVDSTRRRMIDQHAPDGTAWAALNPAYAELKGSGYDILYASGALRGSMTYLAATSEVSWGSGMIYAAVHQFGATILPKNAPALSFVLGGTLSPYLVSVKSVTIPARPYLGISAEDEAEIQLLGREYLGALWSGV